jgi:hypothetical protein
MKLPVHDTSARQHSGESFSGLGANGGRKDRPRNPDRPAFDCEIAGLVNRSTQELRHAWRTLHHAGPPLGLSRDLIIRGVVDKLQQRGQWRPDPRLAAPPSDFGGRVRERRSFFRPRRSAEDRRDVGAPVARSHPYRPRARGGVRIRGPALSVSDRDCRADHRGTLVGSPVLWSRQTSACILVAEPGQ